MPPCLVIIFILICSKIVSPSDVIIQLYDVLNDPSEDVNLSKIANLQTTLSTFNEKYEYWSNQTVPLNEPDDKNKMSTFVECGRQCQWLPATNFSYDIHQKYAYEEAPHIVFVLVDDWGYNDLGRQSTYLSWTTPTIDALIDEGVMLTNYHTSEVCAPSRASLMTGRYALRLGVFSNNAELPISEVTLAQELKSAGYRSYAVGKWHLGMSSLDVLPIQRGFDSFYGYLGGKTDYYDKKETGYVDLFQNNDYVTDETELSSDYHAAYLYQSKAELAITEHVANYPTTPMFLYYAMQLIHAPWTAPDEYIYRCISEEAYSALNDSLAIDYANYCGMNVMIDEAIANLTCTLKTAGISDNTVLIIASDNGGEKTISGSSYPYRGEKGSLFRGGIKNNAMVHTKLLPTKTRGSTYDGLTHVTDWLPTLMNIATNGAWTGGYNDQTIDGLNIWDDISSDSSESLSERREVVFYSYDGRFGMQKGDFKYLLVESDSVVTEPTFYFEEDLQPDGSRTLCADSSLLTLRLWNVPLTSDYSILDNSVQFTVTALFLMTVAAGLAVVAYAAISEGRESVESRDGMNASQALKIDKSYLYDDRSAHAENSCLLSQPGEKDGRALL